MNEEETEELSDLLGQRRWKLEHLRDLGVDPYPLRSECTHTTAEALEMLDRWREKDQEGGPPDVVKLCGRIMSVRVMGKASFAHIADGSGRMQIYLRLAEDGVDGDSYDLFRRDLDIGDIIQAEGTLFSTRTGEPSLKVGKLTLLAKSLRPLPEKWHGLKDVEARYRQRYLDLIVNEDARLVFVTRSRIIAALRRFMDERGFIEVETPVLQPIYGGAMARPFTTYYHALDQEVFLRIADELYLKRLIVGGLDRVYEICKDFRNEGVSSHHNPEFTQLEVYQAYADYHDMMTLAEDAFFHVAEEVLGTAQIRYQGHDVNLKPHWRRLPMREAILEETGIDIEKAPTLDLLLQLVEKEGLEVDPQHTRGALVDEVFSEYVEPKLIQPTFIVDFPLEISPFAKKKPDKPHLVERFELFIGGLELGNAFSELNDPLDQRERFLAQREQREAGDEEAHPMDEDYIRALEYGMPPTGGMGWGIDRMVMLLTDQASIREVILFPHLRTKEGTP
ncbi:MAG: lysine--tRNA ligase [Anaerolineae bacterium]